MKFKKDYAQNVYDRYLRHYANRRYLFNPDGSENHGHRWRKAFWDGVHGKLLRETSINNTDGCSYAAFRAGYTIREQESVN